MLLTIELLRDRFKEQLARASKIDIAVAWVCSMELTQDIVAAKGRLGGHVRIIAGCHNNFTRADCLQALYDADVLKVAFANGCIFHPKLFIFTIEGVRRCWVGSANLTDAGFTQNTELVYEFTDGGSAQQWFDSEWRRFKAPSQDWLDEYASHAKATLPFDETSPKLPPLSVRASELTWDSFYGALRTADEQMRSQTGGNNGVLTGKYSWVSTIRNAQSLFDEDWSELTTEKATLLLGLRLRKCDQLGGMGTAILAKNLFYIQQDDHRQICGSLGRTLAAIRGVTADDSFAEKVVDAYNQLTAHSGIKSGVATRLLALARPDALVSVNKLSRNWLSQTLGVSISELQTAAGYAELVRWTMDRPWWKAPKPSDPLESEVWSYRGALIDLFAVGEIHA